jgi:hypothetical protein
VLWSGGTSLHRGFSVTESTQILNELQQTRDEIRLKIHLGSKDLQDEWTRIEEHWRAFEQRAQIERSMSDVGGALDLLGDELKSAYQRIQSAL